MADGKGSSAIFLPCVTRHCSECHSQVLQKGALLQGGIVKVRFV
jgi:hypothetical protein